jgi:transcriptional regulator with GAF, ATPase, and Fis domain
MATIRTRLTAEQRIAALEEKIKAIKEAERTAKKGKKEITRESEGVENLLAQIEAVAKANKVKKPVLIRAIAKLTRSGLKFVD